MSLLIRQDSFTTSSGLKVKKLVKGTGPVVEQGDLIGVRFKGNYGNYEFDNIFSTAEPYYMRAGVGTLVKVREATNGKGAWRGIESHRVTSFEA